MSFSSGTRLGPYEIVAPLGAGGMGEVCRATDTRLNRTVALKAIHAVVAQDPERVARFEREAQLLASFNHPNIAAIHGIEDVDGAKYLVLEFVEGRALSEVLRDSGPLPMADALAIAGQIADALAAAHEKGIIHRDLKPGNVMVTPDGQVKVLDFGLGKVIEGGGSSSSDLSARSPTITLAATQAGIILGTAGYMSPEQAKGRAADKRSDVWAFGCVLFECLTARRAFDGEDVTDTLAAIVRGEPDWQALPAGTPPVIRRLLERCLVKDRRQRLADMSVVRFLLNEPAAFESSVPGAAGAAAPSTRARSIGWPLAAAMVAIAMLATAGAMRLLSPGAAPARTVGVSQLSIALPEGDEVTQRNLLPLALSPDGTVLIYVGLRDGKRQLYLRALADPEPQTLEGTEGASMPFFSPDGRWIAFFAQGKLKKIALGGAGLQIVADDVSDARGGSWGTDDHIYFAPTNMAGIFKVPASGGKVVQLTAPDRARGEISHRWPHVLPDHQRLLFTIWTGPGADERQIVVQSIATGERHALVAGGDTPRYANGHLVYARLDNLFAVPWRPSQTSLEGVVPAALPEHPRQENEGAAAYAMSDSGTLAYLAGGTGRYAQRVVWVDRAGNTAAVPVSERNYESVALSPDGRHAMLQIMEGSAGLWLYDFARNTLTPFATTGGSSQAPFWTPDSKRVVYRGTRGGLRNLFSRAADGTGDELRLMTRENVTQTPMSMSPDGEWLVFSELGGPSRGDGDIWALRLTGANRSPQPLVQTPAGEISGRVSPDGKWLAYVSNASGIQEVYVRPFPGPGPSQPVSTGGGTEPLWSRDGRELFYRNADKLIALGIGAPPDLVTGQPRVLFEGRYRPSSNGNTPYDVSLDGRRFLFVQQAKPDRAATRIEVVLNWFARFGPAAGGK